MNRLSRFAFVSRILTIISGTLCVLYGFIVGGLGVWVDGAVGRTPRAFGLLVLFVGLIYWVPIWQVRSKRLLLTYGVVTSLPLLGVVCLICSGVGKVPVRPLIVNAVVLSLATIPPLTNALISYRARPANDQI